MRKLLAFLVLMAPAWLVLTTAWGQENTGGVIFSRSRQFRIPFNTGNGAVRFKQVQLYVSADQGRSWQQSASAPPEQGHFNFFAERDGLFWFTVQTLDLEGRLYPLSLEGAVPSLKVIIDTQPPVVTLHALAPRNGEVGIAWEIRDDNFDPTALDALRLEYRPTGGAWTNVSLSAGSSQTYWNAPSNGSIDVRMRARDRAGNVGEGTSALNPAGANYSGPGANPPPAQAAAPVPNHDSAIFNGPSDGDRRFVGSTRVNFNFELKEVGPSGVSLVELWYTQDGRSWNKHPLRYGDDPTQRNIVFNAPGEGVYGITLVAKSGVGLGDRPPQIGDQPQIWVEVDTTKPAVQLLNVLVSTGADKGKLKISWSARDKNLQREPISVFYAEQRAGPWTPIAEKIPNASPYTWTMPERVPYQFHLKVEATDQAGNVGEAISETLIKVDLAQPKVKILTVEPVGR